MENFFKYFVYSYSSDIIHQLLFFILLLFILLRNSAILPILNSNLFFNRIFFNDLFFIFYILYIYYILVNSFSYLPFYINKWECLNILFMLIILLQNEEFNNSDFLVISENSFYNNKRPYLFVSCNFLSSNKYMPSIRYYNTFKNKQLFKYSCIHVNPTLTSNDFYLKSSIICIAFFEKSNYFRINEITKKKVLVDSNGIDILDISFQNIDNLKLKKLLSVKIYLYEFPAGTAEYLNLKKDINIQDLPLGKRLALIHYHFIIGDIIKNKKKIELFKMRFNLDENLFSSELIDFLIQKWSSFSSSKKGNLKNDKNIYKYNSLGKAIGLDIIDSLENLENLENSSKINSLDKHINFTISDDDFFSLLNEIDTFLSNKNK